MELIRDTNALAGGANLEPPTSTANLTALHFACQVSPGKQLQLYICETYIVLLYDHPS